MVRQKKHSVGGFLNFLFLSLIFSPSSWPTGSQHTGREKERIQIIFCWYSAMNSELPRSLREFHFPRDPGRAEEGCQRKGQVVATTLTLGSGLLLSHSAT